MYIIEPLYVLQNKIAIKIIVIHNSFIKDQVQMYLCIFFYYHHYKEKQYLIEIQHLIAKKRHNFVLKIVIIYCFVLSHFYHKHN